MNDPKSFWEKVKHLVKNTCPNSKNISNDKWKSHFGNLFMYDDLNEKVEFAFIVSLHKKGDINCVEDYRGKFCLNFF